MFSFLIPKSKVQHHIIKEIPIETLEILGISQVNPYCNSKYENDITLTLVNFANCDKHFDEKETIVLSCYFEARRCPKCKKISLIPTKIKVNFDSTYLRNEEEIAYGAYSEQPSKVNSPSYALGFCSNCVSTFEIRIKNKDLWVKQAKKLKKTDLIVPWQEYQLEEY